MIQTSPTRAIRFRGRSFLALVLNPEQPLAGWLAEIDAWLERSSGFFGGKPVVVDVTGLGFERDGLQDLITQLAGRAIRVMGIEGAPGHLASPDLPPFLNGGRPATFIDIPASPETPPASKPQGLVIDAPVRSGQSIVHPDGDVTVLGSIASGAEVIAGGSIHVYGALRGRALAGAYGNPRARIFCRKLECELLSIDGLYKIADEIAPELRKKPVQAWLDHETITIKLID